MNTINNAYCELKPINQKFNNKQIYECQYCKMKIGLDSPGTRILCFKKMQDFTVSIKKLHNPEYSDLLEAKSMDDMQEIVLSEVVRKHGIKETKEELLNTESLCSQEQIKERLAICETCEHYKDNSCLLCGCVVVRESNYMNKLAHKDQKCPIDKWGVVSD